MLPQVTFEGRVVADPELRFAPSGMAVANIRAVASSRKKNEAGEWVDDKTCWIDITCFNKMAENVVESLVKGDGVVAVGKLQTDEWTDKETNQKRSKISMIADEIGPSLRFRRTPHGAGDASPAPATAGATASPATGDPWAPPAADEPPF